MRRSASTPTFTSSSSADEGLEVFVATRPLQCKLPHVPEGLNNGLLRDIGCQHYYTVRMLLQAAEARKPYQPCD